MSGVSGPRTASRYADTIPVPSIDGRDGSVAYTVFRNPPFGPSDRFRYYEWRQGDRWDLLASRFLGNSELWWVLLDHNPEITDPLFVEPGMIVVIPKPGGG